MGNNHILNKMQIALHENQDDILSATGIPSLAVTVQTILYRADLANEPESKDLVRAIVSSTSHENAMKHVYQYMT